MKIFFSVGEPSGDLHGANLIRELRRRDPNIECVGYGGPRMGETECMLHHDLTKLAVMGVSRVLVHIVKFWNLLAAADCYFKTERPDAVVLIDYPGFNWWIARKAKKYGIPVFYYGVPQMWAWASWRVHKMRRLIDHVLCKLPFEKEWYRQRGCNATDVGHPYFDEMEQQQLDRGFLEQYGQQAGPLVTILPGSRTQEVVKNLQGFLDAARIVAQKVPDTRFAVAAFNEKLAKMAREKISPTGLDVEVHIGRTPELIHLADCCMACSGSVSLELLYHTKPTVIFYLVSRSFFFIQRFLRKVKYITLVNLLADPAAFSGDLSLYDPDSPTADRAPFPEYLTYRDKSSQIAEHVVTWLTDPQQKQQCVDRLRELKSDICRGGASRRAADYILEQLSAGSTTSNQSDVAA